MFKSTTSSTILRSKSNNVLDIFRKTIADLTSGNETASLKIAEEEQKIADAQAEKESLEAITKENEKIIENIQSIFK